LFDPFELLYPPTEAFFISRQHSPISPSLLPTLAINSWFLRCFGE
jgi:hypothetical protein